ncbi:MAG: triple tyrosine motif-containing protein, partial [Bacteroidota bacterium]
HFNEADGLPNQVVYGILTDKSGNLWISTNKGLSCFTPSYTKSDSVAYPVISGGTFKNFEEKDGLQSNEFNRYAFTKTDDDVLFFGGVNGINFFRPEEIKNSIYIPKVMITDFRLSNNSIRFHTPENPDNENLLNKPVYLTEEITLPFSENMFSFEFAAMDFTAPENNRFRYKLENFDKDWINSDDHHAATYTNLDPGHYTFTVIGSNNDGIWNTKGASIALIILPPWYMTWWFRLALLVVVVGTIYILYRYRLNQALKLLHVRNSIASDLHDEIGSTLSSIYIYSEVAQKSTYGIAPEASSLMKNISTDVAGMIEALGDIVWTVNAKNDRFENIINRMRAAAVEIFEAQEYNLHIEMDDRLNTIKLGMEARRNFYLFYKEAINNVAKYAKGKNVWIKLKLDKRNSVSLYIKDDGAGFNINEKVDGNGLANMSKRAEELKGNFEIVSAPGFGTEINLEFNYS